MLKLNLNKHTITKSKLKRTCKFKNCSYLCVYVRIIVYNDAVHNTAQNSSDYFASPNLQTIITALMLSILDGRRKFC